MDIFRTLGSGSLSVTAMLDFSGKSNTSIHGLGEDDMASFEWIQSVAETFSHAGATRYHAKQHFTLAKTVAVSGLSELALTSMRDPVIK